MLFDVSGIRAGKPTDNELYFLLEWFRFDGKIQNVYINIFGPKFKDTIGEKPAKG